MNMNPDKGAAHIRQGYKVGKKTTKEQTLQRYFDTLSITIFEIKK
jgi:hypothetical protein